MLLLHLADRTYADLVAVMKQSQGGHWISVFQVLSQNRYSAPRGQRGSED